MRDGSCVANAAASVSADGFNRSDGPRVSETDDTAALLVAAEQLLGLVVPEQLHGAVLEALAGLREHARILDDERG